VSGFLAGSESDLGLGEGAGVAPFARAHASPMAGQRKAKMKGLETR
jgi:hypothetical protein